MALYQKIYAANLTEAVTVVQEYPAWWPNDFITSTQPDAKGLERSRRQPRLAYSFQGPQSLPHAVWQNDLVTTQYLDIPSSGYVQSMPFNARQPPGNNSSAKRDFEGCAVHYDANKENQKGTHAGVMHVHLAADHECAGRELQSFRADDCTMHVLKLSVQRRQQGKALEAEAASASHV